MGNIVWIFRSKNTSRLIAAIYVSIDDGKNTVIIEVLAMCALFRLIRPIIEFDVRYFAGYQL